MNKKISLMVVCCLASCFLSGRANAQPAAAKPPAIASADWSVKGAHNLASNPPSLDAVQDFYDGAFGIEEPFVKVCEFRFADLRNSGKTIPRYCPSYATTLVAQNSSQSTDTQAAKDTQAAEAVRHRHLADLMKTPHVVGVAIDLAGPQIAFDVEVDQQANVAEVERSVPSKIEGYDVEVRPAPTGVIAY